MLCWPRSMRLIYCWHTEKAVRHLRSDLLFAKYLELMCTSLLSWAVPKSTWLWTVAARAAYHARMERSGPDSWSWCACFQLGHEESSLWTNYTHFGVHLESQTSWWDDQKSTTKPTLPSSLWQNIPYHLSRTISRLRLFGHNLNIERLGQQQHRLPYKLKICTKCKWHCVQDKEHVLQDCQSADLAELRIKHHHLFCTLVSGSNRIRTSRYQRPGLVCSWVPWMLCLYFTPPCLPSDGFGCKPVWLQLSCLRSADTAL